MKPLVDRLWKTSADGLFKWVTLTADHIHGSIEVMRRGFLPYECVMIGLKLAENEQAMMDMDRMCELIIADGTSIAVVEVVTGKVVGVALNKIQTLMGPGETSFIDILRAKSSGDPAFGLLLEFFEDMDSRVNVFEIYGISTLLEHMYLAVLPEFRGKHLAHGLVQCTEEMARSLATGEVSVCNNKCRDVSVILAIFTSRISQRIGRSLGWDELATVGHDQFSYDGKKFSDRIGPEHPDNILMAKRIITS